MKKHFIITSTAIIALSSSVCDARITVVSNKSPNVIVPISLPDPTRVTPTKAENVLIDNKSGSFKEYGLRSLSSLKQPKIYLENEPILNIFINIIPNTFPFYISKNIDFKKSINWKSLEDEDWVDQLKRLSKQFNYKIEIDWDNQIVQISEYNDNQLNEEVSTKTVSDDDGRTYIIRSKSDDYKESRNSGFMIVNGKAIRIKDMKND